MKTLTFSNKISLGIAAIALAFSAAPGIASAQVYNASTGSYYYPSSSSYYSNYSYPYNYGYNGYNGYYPNQYYSSYNYPYSYYGSGGYYGQYPYYPGYPTYPTTQPLSVACSPSLYTTTVGTYVRWTANVSGGASSQYTYAWSGEGISTYNPSYAANAAYSYSGGSNYVSAYYTTPGQKTATVTVTSGGQSQTRSCGTVQVNQSYYYPGYPYQGGYGYPYYY